MPQPPRPRRKAESSQQVDPSKLFDRVPPHSIEAERAVLGSMFLNVDALGVAIEMLGDQGADVFYAPAHAHIYDAMVSLFQESQPLDPVTLLERLNRAGVVDEIGGVSYLAQIGNSAPLSANAEHYARIVMDAALLRKMILTCNHFANEAYSLPEDVSTFLDRVEAGIFSLAENRQLSPIFRIGDLIHDGIQRIEDLIRSHSGITGIPSGFRQLDEMLSGFQRSDMIILAARPSVGKTAFALNVAMHAASQAKKSVLLFSLEMSKEQLTQRLLCMAGKINSERLRSGFLAKNEFPKLQQGADTLARANIYIDDSPNISILDLRAKARRHRAQHPLDLLIVDYLQLMSAPGRGENRQQEISEISRAVKGLARELQAPVLALSQLSREAEKDDTGIPKLSHLRESGAIEQDADVVLMLSRPPAHEAEGNENLIRLTIAKQRNGPTGKVDLLFDKPIQQFKSLIREGVPEPDSAGARRGSPAADGHGSGPGPDFTDDEPPGYLDDEDEAPF